MKKLTNKEMKSVYGGSLECYLHCGELIETDPDMVEDCLDICDLLEEPIY
jgi:bacteriocin-like protein